MLAVSVKFRDENGVERRGELVNSFRIMVEPTGETVYVNQENPAEIDVMTREGETLAFHRVPMLAIVNMRNLIFA